MSILVVAEHDGESLHAATPHIVAAAVELAFLEGCDVHVLVTGFRCDQVAEEAAGISGVMKVIQVNGPHRTWHEVAPVLAIAPAHGHILLPATPAGSNFAIRVAGALHVQEIPDVQKIVSANTFERYCAAGDDLVIATDDIKVITVLAAGFRPASRFGHAGVEVLEICSGPCRASSVWEDGRSGGGTDVSRPQREAVPERSRPGCNEWDGLASGCSTGH